MKCNLTIEDRGKVGIYMIVNFSTNEVYFGSGNLWSRYKTHLYFLKKKKHENFKLQRAYNRNTDFEFIGIAIQEDTLEESRELAYQLEQIDIDENLDNPGLLNIALSVEANHLGLKHTPETIAKCKEATKKLWQDMEMRKKIIERQNEGRAKMPLEYKRTVMNKCIASRKKYYAEHGHPTKGQKRSDEFVLKNSETVKKLWSDPEYRKKQSVARKGITNPTKCKPVMGDGVLYKSLTDAAQKLGVTKQCIYGRILSPKSPEWFYKK